MLDLLYFLLFLLVTSAVYTYYQREHLTAAEDTPDTSQEDRIKSLEIEFANLKETIADQQKTMSYASNQADAARASISAAHLS